MRSRPRAYTPRARAITIAVLAAMTCVAGSAAMAATAQAGRYHVYSCRTPSGEPAPTDGWSGSVTGAFDYDLNTCAEGGALVAALGDNVSHSANTDLATWTFHAPAGEAIANATLMRAGDTEGGSGPGVSYFYWLAGPQESADSADVFDQCAYYAGCTDEGDITNPVASINAVTVPAANLGSSIFLNASCGGENGRACPAGAGDANGYAVAVHLYAANLVLEDGSDPQVTNVGGGLAEASTVSGMSDVEFDASDTGSGIYQLTFAVDGKPYGATLLDSNFGRCREVGQAADSLPAFLYTQPCALAESLDAPFDTTHLPDGPHQIVISVSDAAGNSTVILDRRITIANDPVSGPSMSSPPIGGTSSMSSGGSAMEGPANGTNASSQARLTARWTSTREAHLTVGFGKLETIVGRLTTAGGTPITGAQLNLSATPSYEGAKTAVMASFRTGADGRFVAHVPRGMSSRILHLAYRSHIGDPQPVATRTLTLSVRAGVALSVAPHVARAGRTILLRGLLRGGPIPPHGKQLVLEARSPGTSWIQFHVIKAGARGRFRFAYRFRLAGPIAYRFRVVCDAEADFPFLGGSSNVVRVREL